MQTMRGQASRLRGFASSLGAQLVHTAALLLGSFVVAALAYRAMYLTLVPEVELRYPLHFGVCDEASPAARRAVLPLSADAAPTLALPVAGYAYAAHLCLTLPESPTNVDAGTFLATVELLAPAGRPLLSSSRALVLHHKSRLLRWMWTVFYAPGLLLGWLEEQQTLCTELTTHFAVPRGQPLALAQFSLSSCAVQVYDAALTLRLHPRGLGYLMRAWFFTSAAVGVGALMLLQHLVVLFFELRARFAAPERRAATRTRRPRRPRRRGRPRGRPHGRRRRRRAPRRPRRRPRPTPCRTTRSTRTRPPPPPSTAGCRRPTDEGPRLRRGGASPEA